MHKNVLITGASGLVGTRLSSLLLQKGYQISHLSRSKQAGEILTYVWDVSNMEIDEEAIANADTIIHLAGAGIADKRWTSQRKEEILRSRTESTKLLFNALRDKPHHVKTFISASAIGLYGFAGSEKVFNEESNPADDFLAQVVKQWEAAVDEIATLGIRVVKIRIGILLSEKGGALAEMMKPIKWGVGAPLGSGNQMMSWIHIDDACQMFIKAMEDSDMQGAYNAVSLNPVTNEELTRLIAVTVNKPLWLPNAPAFVLKTLLGEMANLVLKGSKVSSEKIEKSGFQFQFTNLESALKNLIEKK